MALKATIYKADLQITDMDRHYYHSHSLTLACHPSENKERMMERKLIIHRWIKYRKRARIMAKKSSG